jgi:hypothetical protein
VTCYATTNIAEGLLGVTRSLAYSTDRLRGSSFERLEVRWRAITAPLVVDAFHLVGPLELAATMLRLRGVGTTTGSRTHC